MKMEGFLKINLHGTIKGWVEKIIALNAITFVVVKYVSCGYFVTEGSKLLILKTLLYELLT